jgi:hypothetical protein
MAQNHGVTKRNRRPISHTRGHEGRATSLALRSTEAVFRALRQEAEIEASTAQLLKEAQDRKAAREAKRAGMGKR